MEWLTDALYNVVDSLLSILPLSPFSFLYETSTSPIQQYLAWVNWFIPIGQIITIFNSWCAAILIYYLVQIGLRKLNAIQ